MARNAPAYRVVITTDELTESEHTVEVLMADQLRAELEAPKHGIPLDVPSAPVHTTALWVWSALVRTGVLDPSTPFQEARARMVLIARLPKGAAEADHPVGPTPQGQDTDKP